MKVFRKLNGAPAAMQVFCQPDSSEVVAQRVELNCHEGSTRRLLHDPSEFDHSETRGESSPFACLFIPSREHQSTASIEREGLPLRLPYIGPDLLHSLNCS